MFVTPIWRNSWLDLENPSSEIDFESLSWYGSLKFRLHLILKICQTLSASILCQIAGKHNYLLYYLIHVLYKVKFNTEHLFLKFEFKKKKQNVRHITILFYLCETKLRQRLGFKGYFITANDRLNYHFFLFFCWAVKTVFLCCLCHKWVLL